MAPKTKRILTRIDILATAFTSWIGSLSSIVAHTVFFLVCFFLPVFGIVPLEQMLLVLTTVVSLEAIYLAIFIQMSVNRNTASLETVEEDIGEIQEDVEEIEKDLDVIQEDVEGIEKDIDDIQEGVEEIEKDLDEIQEDVDKLEEEEKKDGANDVMMNSVLARIQSDLGNIMAELDSFKRSQK